MYFTRHFPLYRRRHVRIPPVSYVTLSDLTPSTIAEFETNTEWTHWTVKYKSYSVSLLNKALADGCFGQFSVHCIHIVSHTKEIACSIISLCSTPFATRIRHFWCSWSLGMSWFSTTTRRHWLLWTRWRVSISKFFLWLILIHVRAGLAVWVIKFWKQKVQANVLHVQMAPNTTYPLLLHTPSKTLLQINEGRNPHQRSFASSAWSLLHQAVHRRRHFWKKRRYSILTKIRCSYINHRV